MSERLDGKVAFVMTIVPNGRGVPFVPGVGPSGVTSGLDTSAPGRG